MSLNLDLGTVLGILAAGLSFSSFVMKSMVPLRALALASNVFFIAYGYLEWLLPALVLHSALLPVNAKRLWEIRKLAREIERATRDSPVSEWLLPHMRRKTFKAGEMLFRKGDAANQVIYIAAGQVRLQEGGRILGPGDLMGEIGVFSPERKHTQSVVCETDCELYRMTDEMVYRLYYQHPKLGFFFMRLIVERLLRDVQRSGTPAGNAEAG